MSLAKEKRYSDINEKKYKKKVHRETRVGAKQYTVFCRPTAKLSFPIYITTITFEVVSARHWFRVSSTQWIKRASFYIIIRIIKKINSLLYIVLNYAITFINIFVCDLLKCIRIFINSKLMTISHCFCFESRNSLEKNLNNCEMAVVFIELLANAVIKICTLVSSRDKASFRRILAALSYFPCNCPVRVVDTRQESARDLSRKQPAEKSPFRFENGV